MADWLKVLGIMYAMLLGALAYSGLVVGLTAWVSEWMLVPGIALMPVLVLCVISVIARD